MKKCSLCRDKEAIAKIQWIGKQSINTPFYVCIDCFLRVTTEIIRSSTKNCDSNEKGEKCLKISKKITTK